MPWPQQCVRLQWLWRMRASVPSLDSRKATMNREQHAMKTFRRVPTGPRGLRVLLPP